LADEDDPVEAARRLETALERIARVAYTASASPPGQMPVSVELSARLDALIAQLRAALAGPPGA